MKNKISSRKLDRLGRITIPADFRKDLNIKDLEELEIIADENKIIIRKQASPDVFGNESDDGHYYEYHGNKVAKSSILALAKLAGIID